MAFYPIGRHFTECHSALMPLIKWYFLNVILLNDNFLMSFYQKINVIILNAIILNAHNSQCILQNADLLNAISISCHYIECHFEEYQ